MPSQGIKMPNSIWAENSYDKPEQSPEVPIDRKLSDMEAYDRSPQVDSLMKKLRASQGKQQAQAGARASKLGVGRSSGTVGQMESIAADTQTAINDARQKAAEMSWKEQMQQKQFSEQMDVQRYQAAMDKYKYELGLYEAEQARKRAPAGMFSRFIGSI